VTPNPGRPGEAIPLPDGCGDALFVSTAWHWPDPVRAVPEIARVLRSGGRLGVIWTSRDRARDWVAGATNSSFITASAADQAAGLDRCRAELLARAGSDQVIRMPMRSWCWRADRTSRSLPIASGNN
jgi:SAM-dependent methyltransferase